MKAHYITGIIEQVQHHHYHKGKWWLCVRVLEGVFKGCDLIILYEKRYTTPPSKGARITGDFMLKCRSAYNQNYLEHHTGPLTIE